MKQKAAITPLPPVTLAANLYAVRGQILVLQEQEQELRDRLLSSLQAQGVRMVRLDDGTIFMRSLRSTLKVKVGEGEAAFKWGSERGLLKLDTTKALQVLRRELKRVPKFFERKETEYLSIRSGKDKNEDEA